MKQPGKDQGLRIRQRRKPGLETAPSFTCQLRIERSSEGLGAEESRRKCREEERNRQRPGLMKQAS